MNLFVGLFGLNAMTETVHMMADEMEWVQVYLKMVPINTFAYVTFLLIIGCPILLGCAAFCAIVVYSISKLCCACCFYCCPRVNLWRGQLTKQEKKNKQQKNTSKKSNTDPEAVYYGLWGLLVSFSPHSLCLSVSPPPLFL